MCSWLNNIHVQNSACSENFSSCEKRYQALSHFTGTTRKGPGDQAIALYCVSPLQDVEIKKMSGNATYGFVLFYDLMSAVHAKQYMDGENVHGNNIRVSVEGM